MDTGIRSGFQKQREVCRMRPNRVVSFIKTPIFLAKEYLHRRPDPGYRTDFVQGDEKHLAQARAEELRREGIVLFPRYFDSSQVETLRRAFERAIEGLPPGVNPDSLYNDSIMQLDPAFLDAALDEFLLEIVGGYYQNRFGLGRADAMRLFPSPAERKGSFQWHHDARGRQVHLMVLLSDVTENGQRMTYLRQSHGRYYSHHRGIAHTRFDKDLEAEDLTDKVVSVTGPAGTVALFDANGLHSGNRNEVERRDTLTFCYVSWRHFKKIRGRRSDLADLSPQQRAVMTFNPHLETLD
jgi:hypothetical protein